MENTISIFDYHDFRICWIFCYSFRSRSDFELFYWIVLAIDVNSKRYSNGFIVFSSDSRHSLRYQPGDNLSTLFYSFTMFFGCKTVEFTSSIIRLHSSLAIYWFFVFRLVNDFKGIYKFIITAIFLWTISNNCGALLALQFQLVEYFTSFLQFKSKKLIVAQIVSFFSFKYFNSDKFRKVIKSNSTARAIVNGDLVTRINWLLLQFWRIGDQPVWSIPWWTLSMWLVFIPDWNTTMPNYCHGKYSATNKYFRLWKSYV